MSGKLFVGLSETGWDHAPWEAEPVFSPAELDILLDWSISAAEAAERIGCVEHDVERLRGARRNAGGGLPARNEQGSISA